MDYPIEHLSASSLSLHARCPRQWAEKYIHKVRSPSNSSLIIGSAFHLGMARLNSGEDLGDPWGDTIKEEAAEIVWKDDEEKAKGIFEAQLYHYWELVGKHIKVEKAEQELLFEVPGVDLPLLAYVDAETSDRLIDYKTTAYFNRKSVRPNKEWIFQQGVYQLKIPKPSEVHVITRAKADPVVVPASTRDPLHFGLLDRDKIERMVRDEWRRIKFHFETYGQNEWPGNPMHDWASKYCTSNNCCKL